MPKARIHSDDRGVFVRAGGYAARPSDNGQLEHGYPTHDGNLKAGDHVVANHVSGKLLIRLRLEDGTALIWYIDPAMRSERINKANPHARR